MRLQQFQNWLTEKNISVGVITSNANFFYLTSFRTNPHERLLAAIVFPDTVPFLISPEMELEQARAAGWKYDIVTYNDTDDAWEFLRAAIQQRGITVSSVAIETEHMTLDRHEQMQRIFPDSTFVKAEEKLRGLRMIKEEAELVCLREAAALADYAIEVGVKAIAEGVSEIEILGKIEYELKKKGVTSMSFSTIVLAGEKTAAPHGVPGLNTIKRGDFVLFDLGVLWKGYCSDITRTVVFGTPSEEQKKIYNTVLKGQLAAIETSKPNVAIGDVDTSARSIIEEAGYGKYFTHRIGHGLGIDIHEHPSLNATSTAKLQKGMVYTIEPGIYIPQVGGVRIEDDVVITENGVEVLTKYPKELQIIEG